MSEIIRFDSVHFTYPGDELESLCGISLSIEEGSFVAVVGHNGSGKSTLAKHMNAILVPDEGKVTVCGIDTSDQESIIDIRRNVGMVFQNPDNQIVANVVEDDVAFAPENLGVEPSEIRKRVDSALSEVGMFEYRQHAPHLLSGGQKQRIAIAGVIAMQPKVIVLDEPTAMLDPIGRREVLSTVTELCRQHGMTVVLITHHMDECIGADRMIIMTDGYITADGTPSQLFADPELMESQGLDVPETVKLMYALNKKGWNLQLDALGVDECAEEIRKAVVK
ncbi:MAG: energy-coupling factor transporter ATPase [Oscillospiraceae bacterium]|nr:energy-coupling factor transporter ATPase [Oscillospiraceae bacterium]